MAHTEQDNTPHAKFEISRSGKRCAFGYVDISNAKLWSSWSIVRATQVCAPPTSGGPSSTSSSTWRDPDAKKHNLDIPRKSRAIFNAHYGESSMYL